MRRGNGQPRSPRALGPEHELERLRPLGQRYVTAQFGAQLNHADAEDIAAAVVFRLYQRLSNGTRASNLNALFFTSIHNKAIDTLRARGRRPEVDFEAAAPEPARDPGPEERAEAAEDAAVLGELLERINPRYRVALLLRYGLDLSGPEIAELCGTTVPAAKKLIQRGTRQAERSLLSIRTGAHCGEMRELVRRGLFVSAASELASDEDERLLRHHLSHCGECKSLMSSLQGLHEVAGTVLATGAGADAVAEADLHHHVPGWISHATDAAHSVAEKARLATLKLTGATQPADSGLGAAIGTTTQKVAALCGTGAVAATCLASGAVGPGVGLGPDDPPARDPEAATRPVAEQPREESPAPTQPARTEQAPAAEPTPAEQRKQEFSIERTPAATPASSNEFGGPSGGGGGAGSAGSSDFGFEK